MRQQGKKDRETVKRGLDGGREEGINVEEKERRLGDITVSSHRPVLHCSYKDEHHRGGVGEGGERTEQMKSTRREEEERREIQQNKNTCEAFPQTLSPLR